MYGITKPVEFEFYAFFHRGGGDWLASRYSIEGTWVDDRAAASLTMLLPGIGSVCVVGDVNETVADGTLVGLTGDPTAGTIESWDVAAAQVYTYTAADGKNATWPVLLNGWLYWWEWPPTLPGPTSTLTLTLRKAKANLTGAVDVGSISHPSTFPAGSFAYPLLVAFSTTHSRIHLSGFSVHMALSNGAATLETSTPAMLNEPPDHGRPDSAGNAIGPITTSLHQPRAMVVNANLDANGLARWPTAWGMEPQRHSFGTSVDRTVALHYSDADFPMVSPHAFVAPSTATSGSPTLDLGILNHPDLAVPPDLLFLKV